MALAGKDKDRRRGLTACARCDKGHGTREWGPFCFRDIAFFSHLASFFSFFCDCSLFLSVSHAWHVAGLPLLWGMLLAGQEAIPVDRSSLLTLFLCPFSVPIFCAFFLCLLLCAAVENVITLSAVSLNQMLYSPGCWAQNETSSRSHTTYTARPQTSLHVCVLLCKKYGVF